MKNYEKTIEILDKHKNNFKKVRELVNIYKLDQNRNYDFYEEEAANLVGKETMDTFYKSKEEYGLNQEQFITSIMLVMESYINEQLHAIISEENSLTSVINFLNQDKDRRGFIVVVEDINDKKVVKHMLDLVRYIFGPQLLNYNTYVIDSNHIDIYKKELFSNGFKEPTIMFFDLNKKINPIMFHEGLSLVFDEKEV